MNGFLQRGNWPVTLTLSGAAVAYLSLVFFPRAKAIAELRSQLQTQSEFVAQSEQVRPVITSVRTELATTRQYAQTWRQRCPDEGQLPVLFGQISSLCKAGATATRFEPQSHVDYDTLKRAPVAMGVAGSFEAVAKLLAGIEALPAIVRVEEIRLQSAGENGPDVKCDLNVAIFADRMKKSD